MSHLGRINNLVNHLMVEDVEEDQDELHLNNVSGKVKKDSITVTDNRTGKTYNVPIKDLTINALAFREVSETAGDNGLMVYDPGFQNTAVVTSTITYIDGDKGILRYRGYPIEELAERSSFLEVAYLLINGNLPNKVQLDSWSNRIMTHTFLHENLVGMMKTFRYDAHPMGMLISTVAALGTFYPEANPALVGQDIFKSESVRNKQILRIVGKLPTIAACAWRHRIGRPYNTPVNHLGYTENFLYMLDKLSEQDYKPNPVLCRALEILFILHADHELNCSTAAMRHIASSGTDPYTSVAGAAGALYGPSHGGANEAVLDMLQQIGAKDNVPQFIADVKAKKKKLMGFGHRIYKNYDPRAKIIRRVAYEVFDSLGKEPLIEVATELEKQALNDEYFIQRKLYPNVDFYSGLIYKAMGFPTDMFPVLFTIPRAVGWLAHWIEHCEDPETKIYRPRQVYKGEWFRNYVPIEGRPPAKVRSQDFYSSSTTKRYSKVTSSS
ncbi:citrate synthase [Heterostelium album PN500]|uniref:Citrate synthase n=1 Tax=Heterostelium pallidum (strain ATCC 26659 / Pp 5 / PN500) TaxID=670386 RepID=D3AVV7_HETP5|nr:citrate synthase [Heterostelium album PN500]EFA86430.1 citrate synthase [Heterostelium album PN500]|eukprot:XP_020438535.1 citrate synthase [Heterostelium album PN500]